jgi:hypothetical protein
MSTDGRLSPQPFADPFMCNRCGRRPVMVRTILDTRTGQIIEMFECDCGERNWREQPKDASRRS